MRTGWLSISTSTRSLYSPSRAKMRWWIISCFPVYRTCVCRVPLLSGGFPWTLTTAMSSMCGWTRSRTILRELAMTQMETARSSIKNYGLRTCIWSERILSVSTRFTGRSSWWRLARSCRIRCLGTRGFCRTMTRWASRRATSCMQTILFRCLA